MAQTIHVTQQPVILEGYQAVLKPSKFGYSLSAIVDQALVEKLEEDRVESVKWAESKLKNPKRSTLKPEPWEEVSDGKYKVKFSWNEETKPPVVDTEGTPVVDPNTPLYSGSTVKLAFRQKPYILRDGVTYGTSLKLVGIQVVTVGSPLLVLMQATLVKLKWRLSLAKQRATKLLNLTSLPLLK
jgi:hypothetical protein